MEYIFCFLTFSAIGFVCFIFGYHDCLNYKNKEAVEKGYAKFVLKDKGPGTEFQWNCDINK